MAEGASNVAIARRMFLSERAVERSVTAIFENRWLMWLLTVASLTTRRAAISPFESP